MRGSKTFLLLGLVAAFLATGPAFAVAQFCESRCATVEIYAGQVCACDNGMTTTCAGWATGACPFGGGGDCAVDPTESLNPELETKAEGEEADPLGTAVNVEERAVESPVGTTD
ncbi:MAG: hypothetical protein K0U98_08395 [Deltaproteobacteria bacterium]|nr:hypothetical protein [Deltaproteobacteria bacterium]